MLIRQPLILVTALLAGVARGGAAEPTGSGGAGPPSWANDLTPITAADWNERRAAHLLERAGFGGTPEQVARLAAMTPAQAVASLVDYQASDDSRLPAFEPSGIYPHGCKLIPLQKAAPEAARTGKAYGVSIYRKGKWPLQPGVDEFFTLFISEFAEMRRAGQWWAERMLLTPRPLQEKLALFWHDHFATSQEKVLNYELMLEQIQTLRRHANGNFRSLLVAVAQDPAMLIWLDNRDNVKARPNENFAREVMELFCMGEGQGYTEKDIREVARAFTGWTMKPIVTVKDRGEFVDDAKLHDEGTMQFLGEKGRFNGYNAIDTILRQPATPRHLSRKLYRFFVREDVTPAVNEQLAKVLTANGYELKPLLTTIFLSRDFYSEPSVGSQIKGPTHFLVSTWRKLGLRQVPGIPDYTDTTQTLGQVLFFPPNVAGWPAGRSWLNPATLLARGNYVHTLLFPNPASYIPPDRVIPEGFGKIPLLYPEYELKPHIWNAKSGRMEPASVPDYERYLARIEGKPVSGKTAAAPKKKDAEETKGPTAGKGAKSKLGQLAASELFNLFVGVYHGFVEAYTRVKPIPRTTAEVEVLALLHGAKADTVPQAVDALCRRFLRVELSPERRAAIVAFLRDELRSDRLDPANPVLPAALRRTIHLILSAPEYQLG